MYFHPIKAEWWTCDSLKKTLVIEGKFTMLNHQLVSFLSKKHNFQVLKKGFLLLISPKFILGGIFLVCKNLSFGIVKSKIDHFCKVPCEHTGSIE